MRGTDPYAFSRSIQAIVSDLALELASYNTLCSLHWCSSHPGILFWNAFCTRVSRRPLPIMCSSRRCLMSEEKILPIQDVRAMGRKFLGIVGSSVAWALGINLRTACLHPCGTFLVCKTRLYTVYAVKKLTFYARTHARTPIRSTPVAISVVRL